MSKFLLPLAGIGGVGAISVAGYTLFKEKTKVATTKKVQTFRDKYTLALLQIQDDLWESKFSALKDVGDPSHPKLSEAKTKFKTNSSDSDAKRLQKEGCEEIYNSEIKESRYFQDFKSYCSKTIKDSIVETWITQDKSDSGKWDPKLNKLKTHDETSNLRLNNTLKALKEKLTPDSQNNWDENKREELRTWCEEAKGEIFIGDKDDRFVHAKLYCAGT